MVHFEKVKCLKMQMFSKWNKALRKGIQKVKLERDCSSSPLMNLPSSPMTKEEAHEELRADVREDIFSKNDCRTTPENKNCNRNQVFNVELEKNFKK